MAYRFPSMNMWGSNFKPKNIQGKIYNEAVEKLMKLGRTHVSDYFLRGMGLYIKENIDQKNLTGVEIGTASGDNANTLLGNLNIKKLYCIDPYGEYYDEGFKKNIDQSPSYNTAKRKLNKYGDRYEFIRGCSNEVIDRIPDDLDFVYIDGNHNYEYVKKDIQLYYPKVKHKGIFGGHDFIGYIGVIQAVLEFIEKQRLELNFGRDGDWFVIKP